MKSYTYSFLSDETLPTLEHLVCVVDKGITHYPEGHALLREWRDKIVKVTIAVYDSREEFYQAHKHQDVGQWQA